MEAEIIAVGTELLSFARTETNSLYIASALSRLGIEINKKTVIGDRESDIRATFENALRHSEIIIFSGGLGPTTDDITRETVSSSLGRQITIDPTLIEDLKKRYAKFGLRLTENNRKQAGVPEGARILRNPRGTAPGLFLKEKDRLIFLLPGPPRELYPMVDDYVLPIIEELKGIKEVPLRQLKIAGEAESRVDSMISPIYREYADIETTILSSPGIISLYFKWRGIQDLDLAANRLDELSHRVRMRLGQSVYSEREESIEEKVGEILKARQLTLATAESCTGGLVGKLITDIAGSSSFFLGGVISYSNNLKSSLLGVQDSFLTEFGAVSQEVAKEMAIGIRKVAGSDIGISITGIAGPDGGSEEKPVGTVFIGLSIRQDLLKGLKGTERFSKEGFETKKLLLPGTREAIRLRTSRMALDWIRRIFD